MSRTPGWVIHQIRTGAISKLRIDRGARKRPRAEEVAVAKKGLLKVIENKIQKDLSALLNRTLGIRTYLNTVVYQQYKNAQRKRWMTEGASEGERWKDLDPKYAAWKKKRYATSPGQGRKMLIASGRLFSAVVGEGMGEGKVQEHRKIVTNKSIEIGWTTPYAPYVDDVREFSDFGDETTEMIEDGVADYIFASLMGGGS